MNPVSKDTKAVRIFSSAATKVTVPVKPVQAPRSIVGALECCCKDN
jgi:hypothetical protein